MTKKSREKLKYLRNKKYFLSFLNGLSVVKNSLRPENAPLKETSNKPIKYPMFEVYYSENQNVTYLLKRNNLPIMVSRMCGFEESLF